MQALNKKLAANKTNDFQTYRYDASLLFVLEKQGRETSRITTVSIYCLNHSFSNQQTIVVAACRNQKPIKPSFSS